MDNMEEGKAVYSKPLSNVLTKDMGPCADKNPQTQVLKRVVLS